MQLLNLLIQNDPLNLLMPNTHSYLRICTRLAVLCLFFISNVVHSFTFLFLLNKMLFLIFDLAFKHGFKLMQGLGSSYFCEFLIWNNLWLWNVFVFLLFFHCKFEGNGVLLRIFHRKTLDSWVVFEEENVLSAKNDSVIGSKPNWLHRFQFVTIKRYERQCFFTESWQLRAVVISLKLSVFHLNTNAGHLNFRWFIIFILRFSAYLAYLQCS